MKKILQLFSSFIVIRLIIKILLKSGEFGQRLWSNLKYRALVSNCSDSICHYSTEIKYGENISVGQNSRIGKNCTLGAKGGISIGKNVVLSKYVTIETAGLILEGGPPYNKHKANPIIINDGVWIGTNSIILNGVTIGENAIIGAGTIITKNVPPNSIIVGSGNRTLNL